ncbi:MAG: helix-turn-helix domain-containing protein [Nitrospiraceae bacterium]|nr:helix-turn-helix domain-containing protein [Nitrospiraceae bacterium]
MANTYKRIKAVSTAGAILKLLAQQKEPVSAGTIGEALKIPTPTVMCHLVTLEELGFVQGINDHWRLGLGLALIYARVKANVEAEQIKAVETLNQLNGGE